MFNVWRMMLLCAITVALLTGCGEAASNKAGGAQSKPTVLTLADAETDFSGARPFADAVKRLSRGALVVRIVNRWRANDPRYETVLIRDVEAGKAQLGIAGSRAFDTVGIDSFEALQAPFLIDSLALERQVLESDIPARMLDGLRGSSLVGLAILPGPLRRPIGFTRPLRSAADFRGARIGIRASGVTAELLRALGAVPIVLRPDNDTAGLDGVESTLANIDQAFPERGATVTGNVDFEPRPNVLFISRRDFESLSGVQQAILVRAAKEARVSGAIFEPDGGYAQDLCRRGIRVVTASSGDLAGLRAATEPVYGALESNPTTRAFVKDISAMRRSVGGRPDVVSCPPAGQTRNAAGSASELNGKWEVTYTLRQLNAAGADPSEDLPTNYGHQRLTLDRGRWVDAGPDIGPAAGAASGTFVVSGDQITFHRSDRSYPGSDTEIWGPYTWSVYRDTLTFRKVKSFGQGPTSLVVKAWRRS